MSNEIPTLRDPQDRRLPRISPPCGLVIFGITGDLARKKLLPAIYDLANRGLLHPAFSLTGFARRDWSPQDFEEYVRASIEAHTRTGFNEGTWNQLRSGLRFVSGTFDDPEAYRRLADTVAELDSVRGTGGNHAFYLSIPPSYFPVVAKHLSDTGLNKRQGREWRRVIIEKPFGHNLESARELSDVISQIFDEQDVFRIDHYLGKETVQNIMAMRFANAMFEPLWKANYVDSVQITMAEDIGIGTRAGYYGGIGAVIGALVGAAVLPRPVGQRLLGAGRARAARQRRRAGPDRPGEGPWGVGRRHRPLSGAVPSDRLAGDRPQHRP